MSTATRNTITVTTNTGDTQQRTLITLDDGETVAVRSDKTADFIGIDADNTLLFVDPELSNSTRGPFIYALTDCCQASAKGCDGYTGCRACYDEIDPSYGGMFTDADIVARPI